MASARGGQRSFSAPAFSFLGLLLVLGLSWLWPLAACQKSPPRSQNPARVTVPAPHGELLLQQNLAELVNEAATIVHGRVATVASEPHPNFSNIPTVVVTLNVLDVYKGEAREQFTFRQFVPDIRDFEARLGYKQGQEVLLLMIQPSQYGLSSPAGLEQGRFRILRDAAGKRLAVNGFNNLGLFRNINKTAPNLSPQLSPAAERLLGEHSGGPISYDDLVQIIRTLIAARNQ